MEASLDHVAIARLQAAYGDVVTRRAWPELAALFAPGCRITVDTRTGESIVLDGAAELGRFIDRAIAGFDLFVFTILNAVCELGPDDGEATGRMYIWELRHGGGRRTDAVGVYRDRYARLDDGWRFAERRYASLGRTAPDLETFPFPTDV